MLIRLLCLIVLAAGLSASAQAKTTIKLATLAPDGSAWDKSLNDMREGWQDRTDGRVRLRIYPGGVAGDDKDMVRKMRIGQLHAAAVTSTGLAAIDGAFSLFGIPLFFASPDEFDYVLEKMTPYLSQKLEDNGFRLLSWGHAGWVHMFSTKPIRKVDDMRRVKIFVWAGDDRVVEVWKKNGFNPVALAATDIMVSLQTGMIDGIPTTPYANIAMQWYRHTPYMMDLPVAPLMGATIVTEKAWGKVSTEDRVVLLEVAGEVGVEMAREVPKLDAKAMSEMAERGITIVETEGRPDWQRAATDFEASMRAAFVPEEAYNLAVKYRTEFRNGAPSEIVH